MNANIQQRIERYQQQVAINNKLLNEFNFKRSVKKYARYVSFHYHTKVQARTAQLERKIESLILKYNN